MLQPQFRIITISTSIEFDDVPSGTAIDLHYQAKGATFQTVTTSGGQSSTFATFSALARTPSNTVSADPASSTFDRTMGGVQVTFDQLVYGVSIYARGTITPELLRPTADNRPFLEAFDENGALLIETKYPYPWWDPNFGGWENLVVTSANALEHIFIPKIKSVVFSSQRNGVPHVWAAFDTLRFWRYEYR
jgi:Tol biopolymer transport system component